MIEITILNFLNSKMTVPAYMEKPADNTPTRYVLMEKIGGSKENCLPSSTFAFQSYAESLYQAAALNESLKSAVESLVELNEIGKVKLNSDYNFTDTVTKQYRYQAVYDISHY